jgi:hypothetical protein
VAPPPAPCSGGIGRSGLPGRHLAAYRPQESSYLASDSRHHDPQLLAGTAQPAISGAQPDLCLPGNTAYDLGQPIEAGPQSLSAPGEIAVGPGGFEQHEASRGDCRPG